MACLGGSKVILEYIIAEGGNLILEDKLGRHAFHCEIRLHVFALSFLNMYVAPLPQNEQAPWRMATKRYRKLY